MATKPTIHVADRRNGAGVLSTGLRCSAATGALVLAASFGGQTAMANTVTVNGTDHPDQSPEHIRVNVDGDVVVIVSDEDLVGPSPFGGGWYLASVFARSGDILFEVSEGRLISNELSSGVILDSSSGDMTVRIDGRIEGNGTGLRLQSGWNNSSPRMVADIQGAGSISGGGNGYGIYGLFENRDVSIAGFSEISAPSSALVLGLAGQSDISITGIKQVVSESNGIRLFFQQGSGNVEVLDIGTITAGGTGLSVSGPSYVGESGSRVSVDIGDIFAGVRGISILSSLADEVDIGVTGTITAGREGISVRSGGDIRISGYGSGVVTATLQELYIHGIGVEGLGDASVEISDFASVSGTSAGVFAETAAGDLTISGLGIVQSERDAVLAETVSGDILISGLADVRSEVRAIDARTSSGNVSIQGNGLEGRIEAVNPSSEDGRLTTYGIVTFSEDGSIDIGSSEPNGVISSMDYGIWARTKGSGSVNIKVGDDIEAGSKGINGWTDNGQVDILIDQDAKVAGGEDGIFVNSGGDWTVDIADGAIVTGSHVGVLVENSRSGSSGVIVNNGLIAATEKEAGSSVYDGRAVYVRSGPSTFVNNGVVRGAIGTGGFLSLDGGLSGLTVENRGLWVHDRGVPDQSLSVSRFAADQDAIRNFGEIRFIEGTTRFDELEVFTNESGGLINMSQDSGSLDQFQTATLAPQDGSVFRFDFNALADPFFIDGGETGAADSIIVSEASPTGVSLIDIVDHTPSGAVPLTGSAALIYTGTVLDAPEPGAILESSQNYALGEGNPTTDTRLFTLVDDGSGGVFLQWQPNLSSKSLGAYVGGDLANPASEAAPLARVSSAFGGLDRLYSGGSDSLFGDAYSSANNQCRAGWSAWSAADGQSLDFDSVGDLDSNALRLGVGKDLSGLVGGACGQLAIGLFAQFSESEGVSEFGRVEIESSGGGAYVAAKLPLGLDAEALIAAMNGQQDVANGVFSSSGRQDFDGMLVSGSLGRAFSFSDRGQVETSLFGSLTQLDADPFVDSAGIEIDQTESDSWLVGVRLGYRHELSDAWQAEAGVATFTEDGDVGISAFGRAMDAQFSEEHISVDGTLRYAFEGGAGNLFLGVRAEQSGSSSGGRLTAGLRRVF